MFDTSGMFYNGHYATMSKPQVVKDIWFEPHATHGHNVLDPRLLHPKQPRIILS
jgi:hypothetical protein